MKTTVQIKKVKDLTKQEKDLINKNRIKEFGKDGFMNFKKDYEPNTLFFFVKDGKEVVSFVGLRPIKINYLGKTYNIGGICSLISIKKNLGYGRILIKSLLDYLKKTKKSALGFTDKGKFCKKVELETKKNLINRFVYINPKTGEKITDSGGDGIYYNGKDNFIKKVISTKSTVYIKIIHW